MRFPHLPVEDELEIRSVFARYGHLADAGDPNFVQLFTEDASWTRANSPPASLGGSGLPPETIRGRDKLLTLMNEVMKKKFRQRMHHQMTDFYVVPGANADDAMGHARALITDWREGRDTDGAGRPLDADLAWQPELWRRLLGRVDAPAPDVRHAATIAALRAGGAGLDLPPRLSLFGHTRLPATEV